MPCYCYIIKAWSPRDGGWMRLFGYFKTEQDAWDVIYFLTPFILDFEGFNVVQTIKFWSEPYLKKIHFSMTGKKGTICSCFGSKWMKGWIRMNKTGLRLGARSSPTPCRDRHLLRVNNIGRTLFTHCIAYSGCGAFGHLWATICSCTLCWNPSCHDHLRRYSQHQGSHWGHRPPFESAQSQCRPSEDNRGVDGSDCAGNHQQWDWVIIIRNGLWESCLVLK